MKKQVIIIRGAETFATHEDYMKFLRNFKPNFERFRRKSWRDTLEGMLGNEFEVISLAMPNTFNAKYEEWKIYFENVLPSFNDEVFLVGNSLGGTFLAKYLAENTFPKKIKALYIIASPYKDTPEGESLADFDIPADLSNITRQVNTIHLYYCMDDPAVLFSNLAQFTKSLPLSKSRTFKGIGHFNIQEFPELVEDIKTDCDTL